MGQHGQGNGGTNGNNVTVIWVMETRVIAASMTIVPGNSVHGTVDITWKQVKGFGLIAPPATQTLQCGADLLPTGVTASFASRTIVVNSGVSTSYKFTLTAAQNAPPSGPTSASIYPGPVSVDVSVSRQFELVVNSSGTNAGSTSIPVDLAAYQTVSVPVSVDVGSGVNGTISLAVTSVLPAGVTAQFHPSSLSVSKPDFVSATLTLTAAATVTTGTTSVTFAAGVGPSSRATYTLPLKIVSPYVASAVPSVGALPMFLQGGTQVTIAGGGFGPGTSVAFGLGIVPVPATSIAADGTSLQATVPANGASGALTVTSPAGIATSTFPVDNYRNTRGFSWNNSTAFQGTIVGGSYTYDDATALFGTSQTTLFYIFGSAVENPLVSALCGLADAALSGGQCFGMCLASLRLASGQQGYGSLNQQRLTASQDPPAPTTWMLAGPQLGQKTNPSNVNPQLVDYVHQQNLAQWSQESLAQGVNSLLSIKSAADLRSAIVAGFTAGGASNMGVIVSVNGPTIFEWHSVVAFQIEDQGNGNFNILLYNPDVAFDPNEDTTKTTRQQNVGESFIRVLDGTWTLVGSSLVFPHTPTDWSGGMAQIVVTPWNTIPVPPTVPWAQIADVVAGVAVFLWAVCADATISQVSDGLGHTLLAGDTWNLDPATTLPGVRPIPGYGASLGMKATPAFVTNRTQALTHTVVGSAAGSYSFTWIGGGGASTLSNVPTSTGDVDTVVTSQNNIGFTPTSKKAVTATIIGSASNSKPPRTAIVKTTASAGAPVSLSFDSADTFTYAHGGAPTTYTVTFNSYDSTGKSVTYTSPALSIGQGDTHTLAPDWTALAAGAGTVTMRNSNGSITTAQLKATS